MADQVAVEGSIHWCERVDHWSPNKVFDLNKGTLTCEIGDEEQVTFMGSPHRCINRSA